MKNKTCFLLILALSQHVYAQELRMRPNLDFTIDPSKIIQEIKDRPLTDFERVEQLANANGYNPSKRVIKAVAKASKRFNIEATELAAIGILETGLGKYTVTRKNKNGSFDKGLFQINTINQPRCKKYNLDTPEGSALCAAKLLHNIKKERNDYLGVYHSKTPSLKKKYQKKIQRVLKVARE